MRMYLIFAVFTIALVFGGTSIFYARHLPDAINNHAITALHNAGFKNVILRPDIQKNGILIFKNIKLDDDGFSTIKTLKLRYSFPDFIKGTPITNIKIDALNLTGETDENQNIDLAGWFSQNMNINHALENISNISIINSNIDIYASNIGGINIRYNINVKKDKALNHHNITGNFSAKQKQLSLSGTITGQITTNNTWQLTLEIEQGKFATQTINATRLSGLINISGGSNTKPRFETQLTAGGLTFLNLPWQSANATIHHNNGQYTIIAEGKSIGQKGIEFGAELTYQNNKIDAIDFALHTQKLSDILNYLNVNDINTPEPFPFTTRDKLGALDIRIEKMDTGTINYSINNANGQLQHTGKVQTTKSTKQIQEIINTIAKAVIGNSLRVQNNISQ